MNYQQKYRHYLESVENYASMWRQKAEGRWSFTTKLRNLRTSHRTSEDRKHRAAALRKLFGELFLAGARAVQASGKWFAAHDSHNYRYAIRKPRLWKLVLLGVIIISTLATCRSPQPEASDEPTPMQIAVPSGDYVFCSTVVKIEFPDRRFLGRVSHPSEGGVDALLSAMEMLDHDGLPPRPWPEIVQFSTHGTDCYATWIEMWDVVNFFTFGGATVKLNPDEPFDEVNIRQAVLKAIFGREQFEAADKLFPHVLPPLTE
ncbi:MAG: hypothetical protein KDJ52_04960 [Anaerolineae bacterium]|nr:hypothetical protein [Anaerolineae bacterium]